MSEAFKKGSVPWVYRALGPKKGERKVTPGLAVYIPWRGYSSREDLKSALGARSAGTFDYDPSSKLWVVKSRKHVNKLVAFLVREFGQCDVYLAFRETEICTTGCQDAQSDPSECECPCLGEYHGDGWSKTDWEFYGDHALLRYEDKTIAHRIARRRR